MAAPEDPETEVLGEAAAGQAAVAAAVIAASPAPPTADLIGRTLGKFALVEHLGRGGSGDVYRAEQAQLGRSAVVKVLRREGTAVTGTRVERFLREARLASRLDHPYAAHVYAFGAEPDGTLWIAMEHVRGATLDELILRRGAIPAAIFAPLFVRLCEVLHTAHELGIVHRDIKGSNVMVIERAGQLLPKLIDLGIAKADLLPERAASEPVASTQRAATVDPLDTGDLTLHGVTLGSPHYMAPEQWQNAADVDARADIYGLGVLAYRCLAGRLPFRHADRKQLINAVLREPPPPFGEGVAPALGEAVLRALEKQPGGRWQTALAFGEAVRFAVGAAAPEAVPIFDPYTRDMWLRAGPQPIADAIARLAAAGTTVEADAAVRELVAIVCRWLAVVALAGLPGGAVGEGGHVAPAEPEVRAKARGVVGRDDAEPWLELAQVAVAATAAGGGEALPGVVGALAGSGELAALASRLDDRDRPRTQTTLANDVEAAAEALRPIEPLLAYQLVVGGAQPGSAESWQGPRKRERERVVVWGEPADALRPGEVALLDATGRVVARLSPLAQVISPLPSAEPELFLLWRSGRGQARLMAAPWGFERDDDAAGRRLAALTTEDSDTAHDAADDVSPYPGLAAYRTADAERFVGREREVEALANRLIRAPLIAVLGPSGAGKSSFIHAGVLPRLAEHYRVVTMRPGRHPMHALAALPEVSPGLTGQSDSQDDRGLVARLRELGDSADRGLVIVIDQLEELVTLCADPAERQRFADTLAAAADAPSAPVRVVVTLRDDFAAVIESEASFRGRFEVFVLGTPLPEALRRIVIEPARRAAVSVDAAVVDDMVAEVAGRPASLPLLSFTTAQLWAARDKTARRITAASYQALGGVAGALSTYADQVYDTLARRDQDIVRALFARLVAGDGTRIPAPRRELEQLPGASAVLAHLIDARLLVVREDEDRPERSGNGVGHPPALPVGRGATPVHDVVEIVHECLAERWDRLARWRREDASDRALVGDLRAAARRWQGAGRRADALWHGEALAELRRLLARNVALTDDERAFAAASGDAARRARRLRRGIIGVAMAVLVAIAGVMAALGSAARDSATTARASTALAEDRLTANLVSRGIVELNDNRATQALPYFADALARGEDNHALRLLIAFASRAWPDEVFTLRGAHIHAVTESPRGELVAADRDGKLRWWTSAGAPAGELETGVGQTQQLHYRGDELAAIGPGGLVLVDASHRISARLALPRMPWDAARGPAPDEITTVDSDGLAIYGADGTLRRKVPAELTRGSASFQFDAARQHLLAAVAGVITLYDLKTGGAHQVLGGGAGRLFSAADASVLGYIDRARGVHLIDSAGQPLPALQFSGLAIQLAFSATGDLVGVATEHDLQIFERSSGKRVGIIGLEIEPDQLELRGDSAWIATTDGTVRHYAREGELEASWPLASASLEGSALAGELFAAILPDGTLIAMRANAMQRVRDPAICATGEYTQRAFAVGFSCDGLEHMVYGRHVMGAVANDTSQFDIAYDAASGRSAISNATALSVFGSDARLLVTDTEHAGPAAFVDADHLLVADRAHGVFRWTLAGNTWESIRPAGDITAVSATPDGMLLGHATGRLERIIGTATAAEVTLPSEVDALVRTRDGRWLGAQLDDSSFAILDPATLATVRMLAPGDGGVPSFDPSGDFVLRLAHGTMSLWDRATGRQLIYGLDLMYDALGGAFSSDGRIELDGRQPGVIDITADTRSAAEIIRDIRCRIPLRVASTGQLEAAVPVCAP